MRRNLSALVLLILASMFFCSNQQALEGKWKLINHADIKLDPSAEVYFQFDMIIGQNKTIERQLTLSACYDLLYTYAVRQNDISLSYLKVLDIPRKCLSREISTIRSKIDSVFYFTINGSTLKLFDPTGFAPFVLERVMPTMGRAINGLWQTINVNSVRQFSQIHVNGSHAILCQGQGIAFYNITDQNQIIFTIIRSRGCSKNQMNILNALDSVVYYRIRDSIILYLYDYRMSTVLSATFQEVITVNQTITFAPPKNEKNESQSLNTTVGNNNSQNKNAQIKTNQSPKTNIQNQKTTEQSSVRPNQTEQIDSSKNTKPNNLIPPPPLPYNSSNAQPTAIIQSQVSSKDIPTPLPLIVVPIPPTLPQTSSLSNQQDSIIQPTKQPTMTKELIPSANSLSSDNVQQNTQPAPIVASQNVQLPQITQNTTQNQNFESQPTSNDTQGINNTTVDLRTQTSQNSVVAQNSSAIITLPKPPTPPQIIIQVNNSLPASPQPITQNILTNLNSITAQTPTNVPTSLNLSTSPTLAASSLASSSASQSSPKTATKQTSFTPQLFDSVANLPSFKQSEFFGKWFFLHSSTSTSNFSKYYLIIKSQKRNNFILYGGCNIRFSTYQLNSNSVTFSNSLSSKNTCANDIDSQITIPLFQQSQYVVVSNSQLVFYDEDLKPLVAFTSVAPS